MKNLLLATLALLAVALTPAIQAQAGGAAYYGLSIGELDYVDEDFGPRFEDSVDTWRVMMTYMFMEHLGVEGSYGESSTIRDSVTLTQQFPPASFEAGLETEIGKMLTVRLIGALPFEKLSELGADVVHDVGDQLVRRVWLGREQLENGDHVRA